MLKGISVKTALVYRLRYYLGLFFIIAIIGCVFGRILTSSNLSYAMIPTPAELNLGSETH